MRVISQNQKYDVPYEQTAFISEGIMIYGLWNGEQWLFAEYSTPERVLKAMEMMRRLSALEEVEFIFPKDELLEEEYDEVKSNW